MDESRTAGQVKDCSIARVGHQRAGGDLIYFFATENSGIMFNIRDIKASRFVIP
jgi:hypothetical protein